MRPTNRSVRVIFTLMATSFVLLGLPVVVSAQALDPGCSQQAIDDSKQHFKELRLQYIKDPSSVDELEFRLAASDYITLAEQCYSVSYGEVDSGQMIDHGGELMSEDGEFDSAEYWLFGTKWGAGSLAGGSDVPGPRISGGTVTYSFMADGVDMTGDPGETLPTGSNVAITSLPTYSLCFLDEIELALGAWSAVADIQFIPVTDAGEVFNASPVAGHIRIGAHAFDGASGVLAHAFYPPPNGNGAAGDTHFDSAEVWACAPGAGNIGLGLVAVHEFGHAIGLGHNDTSDIAVMDPYYNPALTFGPLADDIIGIGEIYGTGGAATTTFFGPVGIGTDAPAATLNVVGSDGSTKIVVEESNATQGPRTLFEIKNKGNPEFRMTNSGNSNSWLFSAGLRFVVKNNAGDWVSRVTADGDMEITGELTTAGSTCGGGCDLLFHPDTKIESIEEHAVSMWANSYLPAVGPTVENEPFNLTEKTGGILNELEKAHVYIEQLHKRLAMQNQRLEDSEADIAELFVVNRQILAAYQSQQEQIVAQQKDNEKLEILVAELLRSQEGSNFYTALK